MDTTELETVSEMTLEWAIDEIRFYGTNSFLVMRRLRALLADLKHVVPPERLAAIEQSADIHKFNSILRSIESANQAGGIIQ